MGTVVRVGWNILERMEIFCAGFNFGVVVVERYQLNT